MLLYFMYVYGFSYEIHILKTKRLELHSGLEPYISLHRLAKTFGIETQTDIQTYIMSLSHKIIYFLFTEIEKRYNWTNKLEPQLIN